MKKRFFVAITVLFASLAFFSCEREGMENEDDDYGVMDSTYLRVMGVVGSDSAGSCFSFTFPLEITLPDGSTETFTSGEAFLAFHEIWEDNHPNGPEFPVINYPLEVTLGDGSTQTVSGEEVLDDLLDACEDEDDDDGYDDEDDDEEDDDEEDDEDEDDEDDGSDG